MGFPFRRSGGGLPGGRLIIAAIVIAISLFTYYSQKQHNDITGENQHISISADQEVALGLQAAPEMAAQYGGLDDDPKATALVEQVGRRVVDRSDAGRSGYPFEFHLLADPRTVNAFALPGGQVFITRGLLSRLETPGQLAGVLGHEIGHVVGRHGAEQIAKAELTQGISGAAVIATWDPHDPNSRNTAAIAALVGQLITMKFGRDDELEADKLGVRFSSDSGYDPRAMLGVMKILEEASNGQAPPEFFSTHPNPENRIGHITAAIDEKYPGGVPDGMEQ